MSTGHRLITFYIMFFTVFVKIGGHLKTDSISASDCESEFAEAKNYGKDAHRLMLKFLSNPAPGVGAGMEAEPQTESNLLFFFLSI